MTDLFDSLIDIEPKREELAPGAAILYGFARTDEGALLAALQDVVAKAPFRHMITPGGYRMSVAMTNCGPLGWVSDRAGYRYDPRDPLSREPWPALPESFLNLAASAAAEVGFKTF